MDDIRGVFVPVPPMQLKNKVLVVRLKTSRNAAHLRLAVVPNSTYVSLRAGGMSSKAK